MIYTKSYIAFLLCINTITSLFSEHWNCNDQDQCQRVISSEIDNNISLAVCKLTCGEGSTLWPYPSEDFEISKELISVDLRNVNLVLTFKNNNPRQNVIKEDAVLLKNMLFDQLLVNFFGVSFKRSVSFDIRADIEQSTMKFDYNAYEGYLMKTDKDGDIIIMAKNYVGYKNALVTLRQLIVYDPVHNSFQMPKSFSINDEPRYPHRGVMIDTAHNYMTVESIKNLFIGLALIKINTVHWHITDSTSFSLMTWRHDKFARYGAYSANKVYTPVDLINIIQHAKLLGIRLIPEISIPASIGAGWQWGKQEGLGDLIVCFDQPSKNCSNPPCGQLNIQNPNAIELVKQLYMDLTKLFRDGIYHLGGGDVDITCWPGLSLDDAYALWAKLLNDIADIIIAKNGQVIVFSNNLLHHPTEWLSPSKFIIQVTELEDTEWVQHLINRGYRVILSPIDRTRWDCGFGKYTPHQLTENCERMLGWHAAYGINVHNNVSDYMNVLGAEGLLYSYTSYSYNTEEIMLLKAAGLAERFWTNPDNSYIDVVSRIGYCSASLSSTKIRMAAVEPYWCVQNSGKCLFGE